MKFDLIIIGGGPLDWHALEAKNKLDYCILEKGCLVNSLYNYPYNMTFFSTSERLEIGSIPFVSISSKPTRNEALDTGGLLYQTTECSTAGTGTINKRCRQQVSGKTSKSNIYHSKYYYSHRFYDLPVLMNIPGENLPR